MELDIKAIGIDGKEYIINFTKHCIIEEQKSALHVKARALLKKIFPSSDVHEEVILKGCVGAGGKELKADFLIPQLKVLVETHGKQHYEYTSHFHKTTSGFKKSLKNDEIKQDWAELNGIIYISLPYNKIKDWRSIINDRLP